MYALAERVKRDTLVVAVAAGGAVSGAVVWWALP